ncbi:MAG: DUF512 domain-containing protein [Oscillospiraceae bacterium]|nr:DUF512 domain-containing protein [Oscillospiraceae bacterium]
MSVLIKEVAPGSPAEKAGYKAGTCLDSVNGYEINDVLDYMFYSDDEPTLEGLSFETFLMDEKRRCKNNCVFCFVDGLPPRNVRKMRDALYFKDDDSRLSFLQGNYITLTNLNQQDVNRIIQMKTPVNISVHTTNPELRVKLMGNKTAGKSLETLYRFAEAGISMNCQLVLCPGLNDGEELVRSLNDLTAHDSIESIACVPVGLTRFRDGLFPLRTFTKEESAEVIKTVGRFNNVYAADEFYLKAGIDIPEYEHYGTFPQYENGVGMSAYMKQTFLDAYSEIPCSQRNPQISRITIITGTASFPLISGLVKPFPNVNVFAVKNDFFGEDITVSGLLTGGDIIAQLSESAKTKPLGDVLLIGANTLNPDGLFLDDVTPAQIEAALKIKVCIVEPNGEGLFNAILHSLTPKTP